MEFTVLMAVHAGAHADDLRDALASIYSQTLLPHDLTVVEDGPLAPEHHAVFARFAAFTPALRRVSLETQRGLGVALQTGLVATPHPWVARMDADDIAMPTRFEQQVATAQEQKYDVIGSAVLEFEGRPSNVIGLRRMPTEHSAIVRYARRNNPINHPTALFRRDIALRVGGYRDVGRFEDYDLFVRMILAGARMHNMVDPLVLMRAGDAMLDRRRGWKNIHDDIALQRSFAAYGFISAGRAASNSAIRAGFRALPRPLMRYAYRRLFLTAYPESSRCLAFENPMVGERRTSSAPNPHVVADD